MGTTEQPDGPQVQRRDDLPDRLERRIGGRVDELQPGRDDPGGTPAARQLCCRGKILNHGSVD